MNGDPDAGDPSPLLRVVRGQPTAEELGAIVAVLASAAVAMPEAADEALSTGPSPWSSPALMHRHPIAEIGPGAWQRSLR